MGDSRGREASALHPELFHSLLGIILGFRLCLLHSPAFCHQYSGTAISANRAIPVEIVSAQTCVRFCQAVQKNGMQTQRLNNMAISGTGRC